MLRSRILLPVSLALASLLGDLVPIHAEIAKGVVYEDRDRDGVRGAHERGLKGVRVSNGRDIVVTDRSGRWELPVLEGTETTFFVIKPRGFMPPVNADRLPRFFYNHKPTGSPRMKFEGLAPTGPLPASIDFPLHEQQEPDTFQALFFGDTQPRDVREVDYFKHDIVDGLVGTSGAQFGVTLGDIVFDDLSVMTPHNAAVALIGIPWWNVIGNHDVNSDAPTELDFEDTYNRVYGPSTFSFDHGPVHFIALNDIQFVPRTERGTNSASWRSGVSRAQLDWLKKDLALVPNKQLVLLMMHVPLYDIDNREEVFRLIEDRPYCLSISGHTHWTAHRFLRREDGWRGVEPHHHIVNVTACGSWWRGRPDEIGIPHATMSCGAPNGYSILTFRERGVSVEFRAARRPASYQMNIMAPDHVSATAPTNTMVHVNVFNGAENSEVRMRLNNRGPWLTLQRVIEFDPEFVATRAQEGTNFVAPFGPLPSPTRSQHLWRGALPNPLPEGTHYICVEARDVNGTLHPAMRAITVE